jgi:hypothetical protein
MDTAEILRLGGRELRIVSNSLSIMTFGFLKSGNVRFYFCYLLSTMLQIERGCHQDLGKYKVFLENPHHILSSFFSLQKFA